MRKFIFAQKVEIRPFTHNQPFQPMKKQLWANPHTSNILSSPPQPEPRSKTQSLTFQVLPQPPNHPPGPHVSTPRVTRHPITRKFLSPLPSPLLSNLKSLASDPTAVTHHLRKSLAASVTREKAPGRANSGFLAHQTLLTRGPTQQPVP
ncbi:hypothetical protein K469DRAFT_720548 [Zopfia rhizophila CBS 207.26]|uniref:Uncharacterized protein n=1 Tax=Zopfia rhizophila CBS 207.26 TaxID=1314779 RepID=A0A6A6ELA7_9PEZI|nr:hypothetical protein K469DRAFT_720548 [Zopfia rhizophila CBS 207.26]